MNSCQCVESKASWVLSEGLKSLRLVTADARFALLTEMTRIANVIFFPYVLPRADYLHWTNEETKWLRKSEEPEPIRGWTSRQTYMTPSCCLSTPLCWLFQALKDVAMLFQFRFFSLVLHHRLNHSEVCTFLLFSLSLPLPSSSFLLSLPLNHSSLPLASSLSLIFHNEPTLWPQNGLYHVVLVLRCLMTHVVCHFTQNIDIISTRAILLAILAAFFVWILNLRWFKCTCPF